jgi:hypothetical protein
MSSELGENLLHSDHLKSELPGKTAGQFFARVSHVT